MIFSRKQLFILLFVFCLSFFFRLYLINQSLFLNNQLDLEIYRAGGALIKNRINPYNYQDNPGLRNLLKSQSKNEWLYQNQDRWDYYASANLPANLLLFGLISKISDDPAFYRLIFAFFDSLLAAAIYFFMKKFWRDSKKRYEALISMSALLLGALSPILIFSGTIIPQDKGIEILLLVLSLICVCSEKKSIWFYLGSLFLGLAIAFKGLGLFILPVFLSRIVKNNKNLLFNIIIFLVLTFIYISVWFIPFWPEVSGMMVKRFAENSFGFPTRASLWVLLQPVFPHFWPIVRILLIMIPIGLLIYGYLKKRIDIALLCATFLLIYVTVFLTKGALDRMNIGIIVSILLLGRRNTVMGIILISYYFIAGLLSMSIRSDFSEGIFTICFLLLYYILLGLLVFNYKKIHYSLDLGK